MVRGHFSPRFPPLDAFDVSISRHRMGVGVIGPRDNVFPGPAVALDGPEHFTYWPDDSFHVMRLSMTLVIFQGH